MIILPLKFKQITFPIAEAIDISCLLIPPLNLPTPEAAVFVYVDSLPFKACVSLRALLQSYE